MDDKGKASKKPPVMSEAEDQSNYDASSIFHDESKIPQSVAKMENDEDDEFSIKDSIDQSQDGESLLASTDDADDWNKKPAATEVVEKSTGEKIAEGNKEADGEANVSTSIARNRETGNNDVAEEEAESLVEPSEQEIEYAPHKRKEDAIRAFYENVRKLKKYFTKHGNCDVPQNEPNGKWVNKQRCKRKKGELTTRQIEALDSLQFDWGVSYGDSSWERSFTELQDYKREFGHCLVPTKYKQNPRLGRWISSQRSSYKKRKRHEKKEEDDIKWLEELKEKDAIKWRKELKERDRIKQLDEIGFVWDVHNPST